jgi:hypothetical protein
VGHVLDPRHRKGRIRVPEEKKALPEVSPARKKELQVLGERLHSELRTLSPDPLGVASREQQVISRLGNWAGYGPHPQGRPPEVPLPPCSVRDYLDRFGTSPEDAKFILGLESYYAP